ncbi:hypothetical protein TNCV_1235971 [Trichonephila clavipes]|nr:hypothetical protein TNCV_1235971 [Trichonephila clavipes]
MRNLPFRRTQRPKSNKIIPCKTISGPPAVLTGEGIKLPCVFEAVREIYRNILATASFEIVDRFRSEIQLAGHPLTGLSKKFVLVPKKRVQVAEHLSELDECMKNILHNKDLTEEEKTILYLQVFQKYTYFSNESLKESESIPTETSVSENQETEPLKENLKSQ